MDTHKNARLTPKGREGDGGWRLLLLKHELERDEAHLSWPFDRDRALQDDPNLAGVRSAPLPWKADGTPLD